MKLEKKITPAHSQKWSIYIHVFCNGNGTFQQTQIYTTEHKTIK